MSSLAEKSSSTRSGLCRKHVALQAKHAQLRAGAADRGIPKLEVGLRILVREPIGELCAIAGQLRIGGIGPPGERGAEEHHVQSLAGFGPPVKFAETAVIGGQQRPSPTG